MRQQTNARALSKRFGSTALLTCLVGFSGGRLAAQAADSTEACDGLVVSSVNVETTRPTFKGALGWWRKLAKAFGLHHQTTSPGLVRRFVSLNPGRPCTEFRRSESERILRAQPFLATAKVTTTRQGDSVRVDVATEDEVPVIVGGRIQSTSLHAVSLGTLNLNGSGLQVEWGWEEGRGNRDGFGAEISHPQLFGRPYFVQAIGGKRPLGEFISLSLQHPFYTDLQRIAWHSGYSLNKDWTRMWRTQSIELAEPVERTMWNVGGVIRFGSPHLLGLIGGTLVGERIEPSNELFLIDSVTGRAVRTTDTSGVRRYPTYDVTNVAGVLGLRAIKYVKVRGLDALAAEQDVATGVQAAAMLGVSPWDDVPLRESFASLDVYAANRWGRNTLGLRVETESRVDLERLEWQHFILSGRGAWYIQPSDRWVSELSIEGVGGWRTIIPFQIVLGDRRTGVRGYARAHEAGAQRLLARFEQRLDVARYRDTTAAFGLAAFADAGNVWDGDVPFGITTPIRTSLGAAVLAAVPANSQRTIRAEIAFPLSDAERAGPELRFTISQPVLGFWFEPTIVRWARLSALPGTIFSWP